MEHQVLTPGANGPSAQIAVPTIPTSLPATPGPGTPGGVSTPGVYSRVSLPGQQRTLPTTMGAGAGASGMGIGGIGAGGVGAAAKASATGTEKVNFEDLTDVMGYVGVDLKEESDNIMRDNDGYSRSNTASDGQDRTRIQNFVNLRILKASVERIGMGPEKTTPSNSTISRMAQVDLFVFNLAILVSPHDGYSCKTQDPGH